MKNNNANDSNIHSTTKDQTIKNDFEKQKDSQYIGNNNSSSSNNNDNNANEQKKEEKHLN